MTDVNDTKVCNKCGQLKNINDFYKRTNKTPAKRKRTSDGYAGFCKSCYVIRAKEWSIKNPEKRKKIVKKWDAKNYLYKKEKIKIYKQKPETKAKDAEWRKNNVVSYLRKKRQSDKMFALKVKMRSILLKAFARNGYTKRSKSNEILGCDWITFKNHLESQFTKGMTWENRLEWHIDHIIPLASAKTEDDVIRLNHYTNLRPLWAADNLKKSDKMDYLI